MHCCTYFERIGYHVYHPVGWVPTSNNCRCNWTSIVNPWQAYGLFSFTFKSLMTVTVPSVHWHAEDRQSAKRQSTDDNKCIFEESNECLVLWGLFQMAKRHYFMQIFSCLVSFFFPAHHFHGHIRLTMKMKWEIIWYCNLKRCGLSECSVSIQRKRVARKGGDRLGYLSSPCVKLLTKEVHGVWNQDLCYN